jgi:hypothetical protein
MLTVSDKNSPKYCEIKSNKPFDKGVLANKILRDSKNAISKRKSISLNYLISRILIAQSEQAYLVR